MPSDDHNERRQPRDRRTGTALQNAIFNSAYFSCIATDEKGIIQLFNVGAERMFGYAASDVMGKITPADLHEPQESIARAEALSVEFATPVSPGFDAVAFNASRGIEDRYELTYIRKDGSRFPAVVSVTALCDERAGVIGYLLIATDNTERKRFEQMQQENNVELERAKAAAEKANLAKSDFLSSMSHEIRTPMNAILGMADLLWESQLSGEQREYVGAFRRAGASLLTLINAILDLSKIESGKFELNPVDFHLDELIATAEMLRVRAEGKGLTFALHISPDVPRELNGDADRLRHVLINLLGNAIKFTSAGEVRLDVGLETLPGSAAQGLRFSISDTGPGIPAEKLALIFESFTQADSSITEQYGGTGLGLTISRSLVELMGGRLEVPSEEGKGSVFTFAIGIARAGNRPASIVSEGHACLSLQKTGTGRILLVEDSKDNQLLITAYLKQSAYQVEIAGDGQAAIDKFTTGDFDLVLMDVNMPVMNGYIATRKIREWETQHSARRIPILALTAYAMEGDSISAFDAGCDAHLTKPIQKAMLLKALEEHLKVSEPIFVIAPEGIGELMPGYLRNRRADLRSISAALENIDYGAIQVVGHQMKGSGNGYGFAAISDIGRSLELAAKEKTTEGIRAQIGALADYLNRVEIVLRAGGLK